MAQLGKTIRIYLDDGTVSGIRHAEIINWTGQAIASPRTKIKSLREWDESKKPGVYFLFGVDELTGQDALYVGEAENVYERLQQHLANKDFWNEVIFFTNKDENLTKSHVKYLESRFIKLAKQASRYIVLNGNESQLPVLPRGERAAMEEFIDRAKILLGVLGYRALEFLTKNTKNTFPIDNQNQNEQELETQIELLLNSKNVSAKAYLTDEGVVVLAGSKVSKEIKDSLSPGYKKLRESLFKNGIIVETPNGFIFAKDQLFKSPSQAAAIIVGYSVNGRLYWKTKQGKTLKEIEEKYK